MSYLLLYNNVCNSANLLAILLALNTQHQHLRYDVCEKGSSGASYNCSCTVQVITLLGVAVPTRQCLLNSDAHPRYRDL